MSRTARVLFADDEPNIRFLCETVLTSETCQVFTAADGETALFWLNSSRFDLALLDRRMPAVGGLEALDSLRMTGDESPVVVITAHGRPTAVTGPPCATCSATLSDRAWGSATSQSTLASADDWTVRLDRAVARHDFCKTQE